ncbi:hypothetical protein TWF481_011019 [Arthrobotrys musiformis]|uniref:F-box domain-containing protein n=1 Tax=Arthrobotrys musiformis TaxID=47236 RepID=A0AAV9VXC8_9PEZI
MLLQKDGNGLFAALPTEICHFVLEYMDKESRDAFARCSRHCYAIAFPARFSGVKLSEVNHRLWLKLFARGWLSPLARWIHTVVLDITDIKYITSLPQKLTIFPALRNLTLNIHAVKTFEGNVFNVLFSSLSTLPFYNNLIYLSLNWYGYRTHFEAAEIMYLGSSGAARQQQEIRKEATMRDGYERDLVSGWCPHAKDMLGPHLSKVEVIEKTLSGELYFPKNLQSLELGMGCLSSYYLTPLLNCSMVTTLIFDSFFQELRDTKELTNSLQFPTVKNLVFNIISIYSDTTLIGKYFPNVEFIAVTRSCSIYWTDFIKSLPQVKTFTLPWPMRRWRYMEKSLLELGIDELLIIGHIPLFPTISFSGNYEIEGGHQKYISATCRTAPNNNSEDRFNWEGDLDYKPEDMKLPDFQEEMLAALDAEDEMSSGDEIEPRSEGSEYEDSGSDDYELSTDEEEEEGFCGDSEYWESGDEVQDESEEDSDLDLDGSGSR